MPVEENTLEEKLKMIKEKAKLSIINKSHDGLIIFEIENSLNQPFHHGLAVAFNRLSPVPKFYIQLSSTCMLNGEEIDEFSVDFNRVKAIVKMLNEEIKKMENTILH